MKIITAAEAAEASSKARTALAFKVQSELLLYKDERALVMQWLSVRIERATRRGYNQVAFKWPSLAAAHPAACDYGLAELRWLTTLRDLGFEVTQGGVVYTISWEAE